MVGKMLASLRARVCFPEPMLEMQEREAREMTLQLRALTVPSTHSRQLLGYLISAPGDQIPSSGISKHVA